MRLNSFLARAGVASRRKADELIKAGKVKVNGRPGQLNDNITAEDNVEVNGQPVKLQNYRYILLFKPAGFLSTLSDPRSRPNVMELVDVKERVVPVGRLDFDTTGALLLTNDGQLAYRLMHPRFEVDKVYRAEVEGNVSNEKLNMLSNSMEIDGRMTAPAKAVKLTDNKIQLTIHEGRKHQVKKMLASVGLPVKSLHRAKYGPLDLKGLKIGQWRELSTSEVKALQMVQ